MAAALSRRLWTGVGPATLHGARSGGIADRSTELDRGPVFVHADRTATTAWPYSSHRPTHRRTAGRLVHFGRALAATDDVDVGAARVGIFGSSDGQGCCRRAGLVGARCALV